MEAALFNWPPLITEGLCRPLPPLFACRRLALGSICVYMDSCGVLCFFFSADQLFVQLLSMKLVQHLDTTFFLFGKSLSRLPLPIKYLTLEAELAHPSCQLQ